MRKIQANHEDPIDNIILELVEKLCPVFKSMNFTPNGITTLSLVFGLLSVYALYIGRVYTFAVLYMISYIFDDMDGYYARKYGMTSAIGDIYDHSKDCIVGIALIVVVIMRNKKTKRKKLYTILPVGIVLFLLLLSYLGCQEKIYAKNESESLSLCKSLCPGCPRKLILYNRYFGCGMFNVFLIAIIIYIEKS
jgi:phosphatidylglycerophosphate synthase